MNFRRFLGNYSALSVGKETVIFSINQVDRVKITTVRGGEAFAFRFSLWYAPLHIWR